MRVNESAMTDIHKIFDKLDGPGKVAELLGVKPSAASEMKRRKSVPVKYWPKLVIACNEAGLTINYATLVSLHSKESAPASGVEAA